MARTNRQTLYDQIITELFTRLWESDSDNKLDFDRDDIERVIRDLGFRIRNIPDIKYTYDSRRPFPQEIQNTGYWAITGRGKSQYSFVKIDQPNLICLPGDEYLMDIKIKSLRDKTPPLVQSVLGDDEQATMTKLHYSKVVADFLGMKNVWKVQGHERTTVSTGQIEIDEVYVAQHKDEKFVIPISAKGKLDYLSYTQALNLNLYAKEKEKYKNLVPIPLGICKFNDESIYIVEFSKDDDIQSISIVAEAYYRLKHSESSIVRLFKWILGMENEDNLR
jgi:hypothetical protein